jgi:hypothetical protein
MSIAPHGIPRTGYCRAVHMERLEVRRYFFHVRVDGKLLEDSEGLELPSLESARDECSKAIRDVLAEEKWPEALADSEFHIVDELGRTVLVVPFRN